MTSVDIQKLPPLSNPSTHGNYVRFVASNNSIHDVPEHYLSAAIEIDPDLRLIPSPDFNELVLTAEDEYFLAACKIAIAL